MIWTATAGLYRLELFWIV